MAAPSRADTGAPRPRPAAPRCAWTVIALASRTSAMAARLVNGLSGGAPGEAIARPLQREHQRAILARHSRGTAHDDHLVAHLERFLRHARVAELRRAAPLDGPPLRDALVVGSHDMHERMGIAIDELHQLAFELHFP